MSIKILIIVIVLVVVLIGGFLIFRNNNLQNQAYIPTSSQNTTSNPVSTNQPSNPIQLPNNGQNIVVYTDSGFSPNTLTIKKGDTTIFKNTASDSMRVSSDPHPIHDGYPTKGGCFSSTFDSCNNISPGQSWSFKFDIAGKWGYHNHLNPTEGGTIIVQ